jgi:Protein of unknown function (DUF998)
MTHKSTTPHGGTPASMATGTNGTSALLACGVVAGPLYVVVALVQVLTRDGFDLGRHPLSLLSLGDLGWIQIANFVVAGLLSVASAIGMRRALRPGPGGTWGPLLVGVFGVGLIAGGASLVAACFVLIRRFAALGQRRWAGYCAATGVALLGIMAWPDQDTVSVQLAVAVVLGFAWASALAARLLTEPPDATGSIRAEPEPTSST